MGPLRLNSHPLPATPWLAGLTLVLIAFRALVPAGFMIAPVRGSAELRFCVAGLHRGSHAGTPLGHPSAIDSSCPFAQSAGPAPIPQIAPVPGEPPAGPTWQARMLAQTAPSFGPPREQPSRGPPSN